MSWHVPKFRKNKWFIPEKNAGQNRNMKLGNKPFENLEQLRYFGTTLTNRKSVREEIKNKFMLGNARFHLVQNLLSSNLPSKNVKNEETQNCNFACCFVLLWNLVSHIEGATYVVGPLFVPTNAHKLF